MTEKIGLIKNPLTIIAIFAGIAEVSGTIVLPFIAEQNQELFIYFLICFPSILVILFFVTLNFNNRVLYAPSDYRDEQNYVKINKYDLSSQRNVEVKVLKSDAVDPQFITINEKLEILNSQIIKLESIGRTQLHPQSRKKADGEFLVSKFHNAPQFVAQMESEGYEFEVYYSPDRRSTKYGDTNTYYDFSYHKSIWLGKLTPLETAKELITLSKMFYPHLEYINLTNNRSGNVPYIYIGGSTQTAEKDYKLTPMADEDFQKINSFETLSELHSFIKSFK